MLALLVLPSLHPTFSVIDFHKTRNSQTCLFLIFGNIMLKWKIMRLVFTSHILLLADNIYSCPYFIILVFTLQLYIYYTYVFLACTGLLVATSIIMASRNGGKFAMTCRFLCSVFLVHDHFCRPIPHLKNNIKYGKYY